MIVTFYNFNKRSNSTKLVNVQGTDYDCRLLDIVSVIEPQIALNVGTTVRPRYNYCYIPDFDRYYFIQNWTWESGLWRAYLVCDDGANWKDDILASTEYVIRSASRYDGDITDNLYPFTGEIVSHDELVNTILTEVGRGVTYGRFVVGVIGGDGIDSGTPTTTATTSYYAMLPAVFDIFMKGLMSKEYADSVLTTVTQTFQEILTTLNPLSYISSIRYYPMTFNAIDLSPTLKTTMVIPVGWGDVKTYDADVPTGMAYVIDGSQYIEHSEFVDVPKHPQSSARGNYLNREQFATMQLFYPPFGVIPLSADALAYAEQIEILTRTDMRTGNCYMTVYAIRTDEERHEVLYYGEAKVASDILAASMMSNKMSAYEAIGASLGTLAMGVDAVGSGMSAYLSAPAAVVNPAAAGSVATGITSAISGATRAVQNQMNIIGQLQKSRLPTLSTNGQDGSIAGMAGQAKLVATFNLVVADDNEHRGRPLCEKVQLSTLSGYTVVADPDIILTGGTEEETNRVRAMMANGLYLE